MHCVPGAPAAVVAFGIPDESGRHAALFEGRVHLLCLLNRHSHIRFSVDEHRGSRCTRDVCYRGKLSEQSAAPGLPGRTIEFALLGTRYIGSAIIADPV